MTTTPDFYGLTTRTIANEYLRLDLLATAVPRLVRLFLVDSDENLLAEVPDLTWGPPQGTYFIRGGHRLWHVPASAACVQNLPPPGPSGVVQFLRWLADPGAVAFAP